MPHIEIAAEKILSIGQFTVTNTLLMSWIVVVILIVLAQAIKRNVNLIPRGLQNVAELGVEKLLGLMESVLQSRKKAEKYFPIIATIFTLVLVSNWLGIIPGVGSVGYYEMVHGEKVFVPILRSLGSDLNFTLALAVVAVVIVNVVGIAAIGIRSHVGKFVNFKDPISFFVGLLELLGEFAKMVSFSFRLFGNIFAGEVLLIITGFLAPYIVPLPFLGLEIFVGFIQALVFAMLTLVFISIAIEHHS